MDIQLIANKLRRTMVPHPQYALTYKRLYNHSAIAQPGSIITVVGPTRVGKTHLSYELLKDLVAPDQDASPYIPVARIEASTTDQGFVSTRYIILQILQAIEHPFYVGDAPLVRLRDSESTLRKQAVAGLAARGTKYIIFDEAHHLLRTKSNRLAEGVLDSMKCLGNETGCIIIFIGGYDLLHYQFLSAHLNGRMTLLEFSNYGNDIDGARDFDRILVTIDEWLPWNRGSSLYRFREHIYEGSQGCYGQLIHWSLSALAEMKSMERDCLELKHFLTTRKMEQINTIKSDIALGKKLLSDLSLRREGREIIPANSKSVRQTGRPFQRKPTRDPVGLE